VNYFGVPVTNINAKWRAENAVKQEAKPQSVRGKKRGRPRAVATQKAIQETAARTAATKPQRGGGGGDITTQSMTDSGDEERSPLYNLTYPLEMKQSLWRTQANRVINQVFADHPDAALTELKKLLRDAYPFGERKHHPYKIWCDAQRKALNLKFRLTKEPTPLNEGLFTDNDKNLSVSR